MLLCTVHSGGLSLYSVSEIYSFLHFITTYASLSQCHNHLKYTVYNFILKYKNCLPLKFKPSHRPSPFLPPAVQALYPAATVAGVFDYASYIYLLAPVSLAIINPIGFIFMEFQKQLSNKKLKMKQVRGNLCNAVLQNSTVLIAHMIDLHSIYMQLKSH